MKLLFTLFLLLLPLSVTSVHAETYWVSPAGGATLCSQIDGAADPGAYMTLTQMDTSNCATAGDTVMFKDGTYTTWLQWSGFLPSGTAGNLTKALCESHLGCTIRPTTDIPFNSTYAGVIHLTTRAYVQIGSRTAGFTVDAALSGAQAHGIRFTMDGSIDQVGVRVIGNEIINYKTNGISWGNNGTTKYTQALAEYNTTVPSGTPYTGSGAPHAIYLIGHNFTVRHNDLTTPANATLSNSFGVHCYSATVACTNNVISHNIIRIGGLNDRGLLLNGPGNTLANNIVKGTTSQCIRLFGTGADNNIVYHNVCDGSTSWLVVDSGATGNVATNNICITGATCSTSGTFTSTDNLTGVATSNFVDRTNLNYSLVAGAATLINEGTAISGRNFNGSAPDLGAHETIPVASCVVENGAATTALVTFTNNVNPPLQITNSTGVTFRRGAANDVVTGVAIVGDNVLSITLTDAVTAGQVIDVSYAQTGDLRDSAKVGGSINQEVLAFTNTSCTNNVGAAASHVFTQAAFEFHGLRGTEAAPVGTPYASAPENTNIQVMVGGSVRLRLSLTCTIANCPPTGFYPRYSKNAGAYTIIPDVFAADNIAFCGTNPDPDIPTNGAPTTNQLSTAGAFVAGAFVRTSNAIPTVDLNHSPAEKTELEYCVSFDTDATATDTYDIRLYRQDGTALNAYTVTPRMTIVGVSGAMGF